MLIWQGNLVTMITDHVVEIFQVKVHCQVAFRTYTHRSIVATVTNDTCILNLALIQVHLAC